MPRAVDGVPPVPVVLLSSVELALAPPVAETVDPPPPDPPDVAPLVVVDEAPDPELSVPTVVVLVDAVSATVDPADVVVVVVVVSCPAPVLAVVSAVGSPCSVVPVPQAHARTLTMKPWRSQLMRVNVAPVTLTRKRPPHGRFARLADSVYWLRNS